MLNDLLVFLLFCVLPVAGVLFLFCIFIHWLFWGCRFVYRNPYDRTCRICGRHEVGHSRSRGGNWWWECFNEGDKTKH